jgi:SAM-dependent methyltransferase
MSDSKESVRRSYDAVADEYVEHIFPELAQKPLDRHLLNRFAEHVRGLGTVADLGCGPGHVGRYLHEQGVRVVGVDLSPEMIRRAIELNPGIEFQVGDLQHLGFPDASLAGVVAFYSVIHLEPAELMTAFRELRRVLMPGGALLVAFHIGGDTLHLDELWGKAVSLEFHFLEPGNVRTALQAAGLTVRESVEREPYEDAEYQSRRCYLFALAGPAPSS